jgi:hypothetical protein
MANAEFEAEQNLTHWPPSSAPDSLTGRSHQPVRRLKASLIA